MYQAYTAVYKTSIVFLFSFSFRYLKSIENLNFFNILFKISFNHVDYHFRNNCDFARIALFRIEFKLYIDVWRTLQKSNENSNFYKMYENFKITHKIERVYAQQRTLKLDFVRKSARLYIRLIVKYSFVLNIDRMKKK